MLAAKGLSEAQYSAVQGEVTLFQADGYANTRNAVITFPSMAIPLSLASLPFMAPPARETVLLAILHSAAPTERNTA